MFKRIFAVLHVDLFYGLRCKEISSQITIILIKVKVNENAKENMINSWITKLASKCKEVAKIYDPEIQSFLLMSILWRNKSQPEQ